MLRDGELIEKLPCRLSPREKEQRADDLARQLKRLDELRLQKSQAARVIGESIKDVEKSIADLSEQVRTGVERRDVELVERKDFATALVQVFRADTGEVVRTRPLDPGERQQRMFDEAEAEVRRAMVGDAEPDSDEDSSAH